MLAIADQVAETARLVWIPSGIFWPPDPKCKMVGGHIHVAEIGPSGFPWRVPPQP